MLMKEKVKVYTTLLRECYIRKDVYLLGVDHAVEAFTGKVIAVYHRLNDNEDKWIVVPDELCFTEEEILRLIQFQEQYLDGKLYR